MPAFTIEWKIKIMALLHLELIGLPESMWQLFGPPEVTSVATVLKKVLHGRVLR